MRLGLFLSYASTAQELQHAVEVAVLADRLGFDCVWVAEAYGSDAVSVIATIAARTSRIGIGSAVLQIPGRTPALTAMTAATLDALSGGRFRLGLGVSGPQVSEGWHGVKFADPIGRTAEYVGIVRQALSRRRVVSPGPHYPLPLADGEGKSLVLAFRPERADIPVYLAALGPKNLELTGRVADGWLGIFVDPGYAAGQLAIVRAAAAAAGRGDVAFDFAASVPLSVDPDAVRAADRVRAHAALYVGGMGSRKTNFYHRLAADMGFGAQADEVQARFAARDYEGAAAAVPFEFLDSTCLIGEKRRIAERLTHYAGNGITSVNVSLPTLARDLEGSKQALHTVLEAAELSGVLG